MGERLQIFLGGLARVKQRTARELENIFPSDISGLIVSYVPRLFSKELGRALIHQWWDITPGYSRKPANVLAISRMLIDAGADLSLTTPDRNGHEVTALDLVCKRGAEELKSAPRVIEFDPQPATGLGMLQDSGIVRMRRVRGLWWCWQP